MVRLPIRIAFLYTAIALVIGSAPAVQAQAFANYEIVSASGAGTQNAMCPVGKKAIGGGASVPGFQFLHESRPETGGAGWRATAQANAFVVAYAVCAHVDDSYAIATSSGAGTQTAACAGARKALGGGAFVASFDFVHESRPDTGGTGWRASADGNASIVAYAICADVDGTYEIASASGPGTQNATCPAGKEATGGGALVPSAVYLHEDRPDVSGTAWRATAQGNAFLQTYAVCATPAASVPGEVPMLTVEKISASALRLSWTASCSIAAADYGIYSGTIGTWYGHAAIDCDDDGADLWEVVAMPSGNVYYLVTPTIPGQEGSYGRRSSGSERPVGSGTCEPNQLVTTCSP